MSQTCACKTSQERKICRMEMKTDIITRTHILIYIQYSTYSVIYTLYVFIEINLVVSTYPIREYTGVRLYILYEPQIGL